MIGIIGGYGDVGLHAARALQDSATSCLKIGGRNPGAAQVRLGAEFPGATWARVDINEEKSLDAFIDGCELVVNCAGPSHMTSARVAKRCLARGCHHVDAGVSDELEAMSGTPHGTTVVYGAGATPGLSELLPLWLSGGFDRVESLTAYTGVLDRFTASGAEDYLVGVLGGTNEPLAAWREGARCSSALGRRAHVSLPTFPREVTLYPYLDAESEFVARKLSLRNGAWHLVVDGTHMASSLEGAHAQFVADADIAVKELCKASALDAAGRRTYVKFLVELAGVRGGTALARTVMLESHGISFLTGSVAAAVAMTVLDKKVPGGVYPLMNIPGPENVIMKLREGLGSHHVTIWDCSIEDLRFEVEGVL